MSDLPNVGMADAPHEPALILYLPDQPLPALLADAALDASPQERQALAELLHGMLVLEPQKRSSAASALLRLGPLYSRVLGDV